MGLQHAPGGYTMIWFLFAIGVLWIMLGTFMVCTTQDMRKHYFDKLKAQNPRRWSVLAIPVGVLLLLAASSSSQVTFIVILGLISLAKGLLFLFAPVEKARKITDWWFEATDKIHKVAGVATIVLGMAVLATIVH